MWPVKMILCLILLLKTAAHVEGILPRKKVELAAKQRANRPRPPKSSPASPPPPPPSRLTPGRAPPRRTPPPRSPPTRTPSAPDRTSVSQRPSSRATFTSVTELLLPKSSSKLPDTTARPRSSKTISQTASAFTSTTNLTDYSNQNTTRTPSQTTSQTSASQSNTQESSSNNSMVSETIPPSRTITESSVSMKYDSSITLVLSSSSSTPRTTSQASTSQTSITSSYSTEGSFVSNIHSTDSASGTTIKEPTSTEIATLSSSLFFPAPTTTNLVSLTRSAPLILSAETVISRSLTSVESVKLIIISEASASFSTNSTSHHAFLRTSSSFISQTLVSTTSTDETSATIIPMPSTLATEISRKSYQPTEADVWSSSKAFYATSTTSYLSVVPLANASASISSLETLPTFPGNVLKSSNKTLSVVVIPTFAAVSSASVTTLSKSSQTILQMSSAAEISADKDSLPLKWYWSKTLTVVAKTKSLSVETASSTQARSFSTSSHEPPRKISSFISKEGSILGTKILSYPAFFSTPSHERKSISALQPESRLSIITKSAKNLTSQTTMQSSVSQSTKSSDFDAPSPTYPEINPDRTKQEDKPIQVATSFSSAPLSKKSSELLTSKSGFSEAIISVQPTVTIRPSFYSPSLIVVRPTTTRDVVSSTNQVENSNCFVQKNAKPDYGVFQTQRPGIPVPPDKTPDQIPAALPKSTSSGQRLVNLLPMLPDYNRTAVASLSAGLPVIIFRLRVQCADICTSKFNNTQREQFKLNFRKDIQESLISEELICTLNHIEILNIAGMDGSTIVQFTLFPLGDGTSAVSTSARLKTQLLSSSSYLRTKTSMANILDPQVYGIDVLTPVQGDNLVNTLPQEQVAIIGIVSALISFVIIGLFAFAARRYTHRVKSEQSRSRKLNPARPSWWYKSLLVDSESGMFDDVFYEEKNDGFGEIYVLKKLDERSVETPPTNSHEQLHPSGVSH